MERTHLYFFVHPRYQYIEQDANVFILSAKTLSSILSEFSTTRHHKNDVTGHESRLRRLSLR